MGKARAERPKSAELSLNGGDASRRPLGESLTTPSAHIYAQRPSLNTRDTDASNKPENALPDVKKHHQVGLGHGERQGAMGKGSRVSRVKFECRILAETQDVPGSYWPALLNKEPQPKSCVVSQASRMSGPTVSKSYHVSVGGLGLDTVHLSGAPKLDGTTPRRQWSLRTGLRFPMHSVQHLQTPKVCVCVLLNTDDARQLS